MEDLNKLRARVKSQEATSEGLKRMTEGKGSAYENYVAFKNASLDEKERIAAENETNAVAYEQSLEQLARLRGEFPEVSK